MYDYELSLDGRAAKQYALLRSVLRKDLPIDGLPTYLVFNPGRVHSVMADVSAKALAERKCFLCPDGIEDKQQTLVWEGYAIRVNPFPIFEHHYTVSSLVHEPQRIRGHYRDMLTLASALPHYTLFYNGPRCGASAPDHMHFQAVPQGSLPLQVWCDEHGAWPHDGEVLTEQVTVFCPSAHLISGRDKEAMETALQSVITDHGHDFNIASWQHEQDGRLLWRTLIIFRSKTRPACFFAENESERILFSPGTVEMCGVGVVSSEDSFRKIDAPTLRSMIHEVSLDLVNS